MADGQRVANSCGELAVQKSDSVILSFAKPKSDEQNWLGTEIASAAILAFECLVFVVAFCYGVSSVSGFGEYAAIASVFIAVWLCLALEFVAILLAVLGARRRNQVTFLVGLHGLLFAILGFMSLPTLF